MIDHKINKVITLFSDIIKEKRINKKLLGASTSGHIGAFLKEALDNINNLYERKDNVTGVATGFHDLDIMTAGLQKSNLIFVAGRPAMGKTAFLLSLLINIGCEQKIPCAYFTLDDSREMLIAKMLCNKAGVNTHKVRTGFLSKSDWPKLNIARERLDASSIYLDDTPALTKNEFIYKVAKLKKEHNINLIFIDTLMKMRNGLRCFGSADDMISILAVLRKTAKDLGITIVCSHKLTRATEERDDHRPRLSDLHYSGIIERMADIVMLLYREEYYDPTEENEGLADIMLAKHRNGPVGRLTLNFEKEYLRFSNISRLVNEEGF